MSAAHPQTLMEAITYFSEGDNAHDFMVGLRWPNGVCCPKCESNSVIPIRTRKTWECKGCKKQFSVRVGTIFEDSPLPLHKWLSVIWLITNAKNGISSYEVHRAVGVTQKTAWFMLQRIRLGMQSGTFEKAKGVVEVDETYIGPTRGRMSLKKRRLIRGTGMVGKQAVVGFMERGGKVKALHHKGAQTREGIDPVVRANVEAGSTVYTDELSAYDRLHTEYVHGVIRHAEKYVSGQVHTNTMENFWALLKRTLKGTYIHVDPTHLFRYLDEQVFRFNNRKDNDAGRFELAAAAVVGKRLTYRQLTA